MLHERVIEFPYALPDVYLPFLGWNTNGVSVRRDWVGGCVSFAEHLGKPLDAALWHTLTRILKVRGLRIYGPGFAEEKTIAPLSHPCANVRLGEDYLVRDIELWV